MTCSNINGVSVRPATDADVAFLRQMIWESLMASPKVVARVGVERLREEEDRTWAAWPEPGASAFIAELADGTPIGAITLKVHERDGDRIVGYRLGIAVEREYRGQGIGRQLLERAKSFSQAAGAEYLCLHVDPSNEPAIRAYQATGFEPGDPIGAVPMIIRFER